MILLLFQPKVSAENFLDDSSLGGFMEWFNSATRYAILLGLFLIVLVIVMEYCMRKIKNRSK